ncbi:MAG: hypothetical protein DCC58_21100, partial [Chloroflexi bacterium]
KWRIAWLRSEHPDAQIETELLAVDEERALCKASVRLPTGGSATAHASAGRSSAGSAVEVAEMRALGRALAALGYGTEYAEEDSVAARPLERPVSLVPAPAPTPVRPLREPEPREVEASEPLQPLPRPERAAHTEASHVAEPAEPAPPRPLQRTVAEQRMPEPPARGERPERPARDNVASEESKPDAAPGVDVSWTRFWEWAKERGYRDRNHLMELLGVDVLSMSPREVRNLIRKYEVAHPPPGRSE